MKAQAKAPWFENLREMVADFVSLAIEGKNEPALTWLLQRTVAALYLIGIEPECIVKRVYDSLPGEEA